jgi:hypothetical protein
LSRKFELRRNFRLRDAVFEVIDNRGHRHPGAPNDGCPALHARVEFDQLALRPIDARFLHGQVPCEP